MRMKITKAFCTAARWIDRVLAVHVPVDKVYGLRTR